MFIKKRNIFLIHHLIYIDCMNRKRQSESFRRSFLANEFIFRRLALYKAKLNTLTIRKSGKLSRSCGHYKNNSAPQETKQSK